MLLLRIIPEQFATFLFPYHEKLAAIQTWNIRRKTQWPESQLHWLGIGRLEEPCFFAPGPEVAFRHKDEIPPVLRPLAVKRRAVPTGKQGMKPRAIGCYFPQRIQTGFGVHHIKAHPLPVRGPAEILR